MTHPLECADDAGHSFCHLHPAPVFFLPPLFPEGLRLSPPHLYPLHLTPSYGRPWRHQQGAGAGGESRGLLPLPPQGPPRGGCFSVSQRGPLVSARPALLACGPRWALPSRLSWPVGPAGLCPAGSPGLWTMIALCSQAGVISTWVHLAVSSLPSNVLSLTVSQ